jgi:hypothetical protein
MMDFGKCILIAFFYSRDRFASCIELARKSLRCLDHTEKLLANYCPVADKSLSYVCQFYT